MKVLITTDCVGGIWTYALDLCRALGPHVEFILATMGPPPSSAQRDEARRVPNITLRESAFRLEWMREPWDDVHRAGEWLLDLERAESPDIVHLNGYAHGALPWHAPTLIVGHSCVLSWWEAVKGEPPPAEWSTYQQTVELGLHGVDLVVAPSHAMLNALEQHYRPLHRTRVIYNGRDPSIYYTADKRPFILSAGRLWDEAKNLAALEQIADRIPWPVCVAGQTVHPDGARMSSNNVNLLGQLDTDALARTMAKASIYALPARYEPFGLSALEAALSGCALVLGDIQSLHEIWADAALFVAPDDHKGLLHAINRLIADPDLLLKMSLRARARARRFSVEKLVDGYGHAYESIHHSKALHA